MLASGKYVIYARFTDSEGIEKFWPCQDWESHLSSMRQTNPLLPHSWNGTTFDTSDECEVKIKTAIKAIKKAEGKVPYQYVIFKVGSKHLPIDKIGRCTKTSIELMHPLLKRELELIK